MQISVIIPTHNRARLVRRAVDSVLKQSRKALEVIVVDDGSTDETQSFLQEFKDDIRVITLPENHGVSHARNRGIEAAKGEWLAFLDSDDRWHLDKLEWQATYHHQHPDLLISQCDEIWMRNGVRVNPMQKHAKLSGTIFLQCLPRCIISPSAVLLHRSLLDRVGTFDENLPACEDYDLWLRVAREVPVGFLSKQLLTRYGGHADQLSRRFWGMDRFRIQALEKHVGTNLEPLWQNALLEELVRKCTIVAQGALKRDHPETAQIYFEKAERFGALRESEDR